MQLKMGSSSNSRPTGNAISFNGQLFTPETPLITAGNRGFRYGDGLFETIRVVNSEIRLANLHFERLLAGMRSLLFEPPYPTADDLSRQILDLCKHNGHANGARVRLMIFRGEGGLHDPDGQKPSYIIQSEPWPSTGIELNKEGYKLGIYPEGRKSCDELASIKSNNYLLYSMASRYARTRGWDDCLVLNAYDRIAESSIANLFYCKKGIIYTPPLTEGCIAGVMRRWLIAKAPSIGIPIIERPLTQEELGEADEVFLTNALRGIKWAGSLDRAHYTCHIARLLHEAIMQEL